MSDSGKKFILVDKLSAVPRKFSKLYNSLLILALTNLTGCVMVRRFLSLGDYGVEKFIRGRGGAVTYLVCGVFGALLLFVTNRSRSSDDMIARKRIGLVLLLVGIFIMLIRNYLAFYYVGRKTPY